MKYFAYGSNMSLARLRARAPRSLPSAYVQRKISSVASVQDIDRLRDASQRAIHIDALQEWREAAR